MDNGTAKDPFQKELYEGRAVDSAQVVDTDHLFTCHTKK